MSLRRVSCKVVGAGVESGSHAEAGTSMDKPTGKFKLCFISKCLSSTESLPLTFKIDDNKEGGIVFRLFVHYH